MLRYSLGSLFLAVLYLSIGCAALVNASGIWPQIAVTLTLAILVVFTLGAIFWTDRRRVFAIGFSAAGWLYFLLVFSTFTNVRPYLLTESATNQLFVTMHSQQMGPLVVYRTVTTPNGPARVQTAMYASPVLPQPLPTPAASNPTSTVYASPMAQPYAQTLQAFYPANGQQFVDSQSFANIGHSMWAVIIAFAGGITAQLLAKNRKLVSAVKSDVESPA